MPNGLIVRPAKQSDLDVLVRFSAAMALETEGRRLDRRRLRLGTQAVLRKSEHGFYLVAEQKNRSAKRVVGQLLVTFEWSDWRNAVFWWIQSVYVDAAWRRRGVYRRMHEAVLALAKKRGGVCGIRLYVERKNKVAKTAYAKVGLGASSYHVFESDFVLPGTPAPSRRRAGTRRSTSRRRPS
jgi:GNAT superfamily N-acetyltransferase